MRFAHKIGTFADELVELGYEFHKDDFSWRHPNGAFMSMEAVRDIEIYWGRVMVARVLDFLELHGHKRGFSVSCQETGGRGMLGYTLQLSVYPQSLLEAIAIAAAD
jgi:hypothetical protein